MMNSGAEGKGVRALQFSLNNCYISKLQDKLKEDGKYGKLTKAAVKAAQKRIGADQDGIYGPETQSKMSWYGDGLSFPDNRCFLYKYTLGGCPR
jgi:peptidoglycan hydrolase-like protein with peptidoglycan-binding domain